MTDANQWMLVFDGECRFCLTWVGRVRRRDRRERLRFVALQDEAAWSGVPGLTRASLQCAVHLVSPAGRVYAGGAAAAPLLRLLPGGRIAAAPFALPGAERIAAAVYAWIARRRHQHGSGSSACTRRD